jgi:guanylate kinase
MDMYVPDIPGYISNRNGMIYILTGSGGSGKTNLLLNLFKSKDLYKKKSLIIYFIFVLNLVFYH